MAELLLSAMRDVFIFSHLTQFLRFLSTLPYTSVLFKFSGGVGYLMCYFSAFFQNAFLDTVARILYNSDNAWYTLFLSFTNPKIVIIFPLSIARDNLCKVCSSASFSVGVPFFLSSPCAKIL